MSLGLIVTLIAASACAQSDLAAKVFPDQPDPLMGNYEGRWNAAVDVDPEAAAQIIALGGDEYQIILKAKHDMRCPPKLVATVRAAKGALEFKQDTWYGVIKDGTFSGGHGNKEKFEMIDQVIENQGDILVNQIHKALTTVIKDVTPQPKAAPTPQVAPIQKQP